MSEKLIDQRYEILEKIEESRFFSVYKALDKVHKRLVALKVLRANYVQQPQFAERVLKEIQAVANLSHPNIVRIYHSGKEGNAYFIATEFVDGESLEARLRKRKMLSLEESLSIAADLCHALDYAHEIGIVHGAVRPNQVLVTEDGVAKLKDFGLARAIAGSPELQAEDIVRSAPYISPEQAKGMMPSRSSDLYSLGVVIFEMLTGQVPFDGKTPFATALMHLQEAPPVPRALRQEIPKALEKVILKLLEKDPQRRYETVYEALQALEGIRSAIVSEVEPVRTRIRLAPTVFEEVGRPLLRTFAWILWVLVATLALLLLLWYGWKITTPKEVIVPNLVGMPMQQAKEELKKLKLDLLQTGEEYSEEAPKDCVLRTDPESGRTVKEGRTIFVVVSKGSAYALVPNLQGLSLEEARSKIESSELMLGNLKEAEHDTIPIGCVISQAPAPGTRVKKETPVALTLSKGPKLGIPTSTLEEAPSEKTATVQFTVPEGPESQEVKVVVIDDDNPEGKIVYDEFHAPGDKVDEKVSGIGKVTIQIYIDDKLKAEKKL